MTDIEALKEKQLALATKLQTRWLERMDYLFDSGEITSTDMATLSRFLMANGWTLDPSKLPESLKNKLTDKFNPDDIDDERVVGRIA